MAKPLAYYDLPGPYGKNNPFYAQDFGTFRLVVETGFDNGSMALVIRGPYAAPILLGSLIMDVCGALISAKRLCSTVK